MIKWASALLIMTVKPSTSLLPRNSLSLSIITNTPTSLPTSSVQSEGQILWFPARSSSKDPFTGFLLS